VFTPYLGQVRAVPSAPVPIPAQLDSYTAQPTADGPAPHIAGTVPPKTLVDVAAFIDRASSRPFQARQLLIATQSAEEPPLRAVVAPGAVEITVIGVAPALTYRRVFQLGAGEAVKLNVGAYRAVRVEIGFSSLVGYSVVAVASSGDLSGGRDVARLAVVTPGAGIFPVPPGADQVSSAAGDGAFAWVQPVGVGTTTIAAPMAANETRPVLGAYYSVGGPFTGVWRIQL
jgi:hypothetical protein